MKAYDIGRNASFICQKQFVTRGHLKKLVLYTVLLFSAHAPRLEPHWFGHIYYIYWLWLDFNDNHCCCYPVLVSAIRVERERSLKELRAHAVCQRAVTGVRKFPTVVPRSVIQCNSPRPPGLGDCDLTSRCEVPVKASCLRALLM